MLTDWFRSRSTLIDELQQLRARTTTLHAEVQQLRRENARVTALEERLHELTQKSLAEDIPLR